MREPATYPTTVWNGLSDNTQRTNRNDDAPPDSRDWDRLVAEVIATQTQLDTTAGEAAGAAPAGAMRWKGNWADPTAYVIGDMVYNTSDFIYYVALADNSGKTPGDAESICIWDPISQPITGLPEITGVLLPADGDYTLTINSGVPDWVALVSAPAAATTITGFVPAQGKRAAFKVGSPIALGRQAGAVSTADFTSNLVTSNITANSFNTGNEFNSLSFTVVETANQATLETTYCSVAHAWYTKISNTANTNVADVVAEWVVAEPGIEFTYAGADVYDPATNTYEDLQLVMNADGADEGVYMILASSGSLAEATVVGLLSSDTPTDVVQIDGTLTLTANQLAEVIEAADLTDGYLVAGTAFYLTGSSTLGSTPYDTDNAFVTPIAIALNQTQLRLKIGLPVTTTVGA